jgi:hypothetical protein
MRGMIDPQTGEVLKTPEEEQYQVQIAKFK